MDRLLWGFDYGQRHVECSQYFRLRPLEAIVFGSRSLSVGSTLEGLARLDVLLRKCGLVPWVTLVGCWISWPA